jgi:hypothetical protein
VIIYDYMGFRAGLWLAGLSGEALKMGVLGYGER